MISITSPTMLDASRVTGPQIIPEALLTTRGYFAPAPWQYLVFSELHKLEKSPPGTGGVGELTVAQDTIMFARTVLAELRALNVPSPIVCPISGGGLGMVWSLGSKQLEVVLAADQSGSFILSKNEQIVGDGDIGTDSTSELERALRSVVSV
jgi:hypothetical protein